MVVLCIIRLNMTMYSQGTERERERERDTERLQIGIQRGLSVCNNS